VHLTRLVPIFCVRPSRVITKVSYPLLHLTFFFCSSAASTMHNRSQVSLGPSFSAAPVPYSTSLDEDFMNSHQSRLPHFLFEDNAGDRASQMPNGHSSMAANCYGVMLNSSFNAPEFDDSTSFKSSHSEHLGSGIQ